jgi:hypothetical protein
MGIFILDQRANPLQPGHSAYLGVNAARLMDVSGNLRTAQKKSNGCRDRHKDVDGFMKNPGWIAQI